MKRIFILFTCAFLMCFSATDSLAAKPGKKRGPRYEWRDLGYGVKVELPKGFRSVIDNQVAATDTGMITSYITNDRPYFIMAGIYKWDSEISEKMCDTTFEKSDQVVALVNELLKSKIENYYQKIFEDHPRTKLKALPARLEYYGDYAAVAMNFHFHGSSETFYTSMLAIMVENNLVWIWVCGDEPPGTRKMPAEHARILDSVRFTPDMLPY